MKIKVIVLVLVLLIVLVAILYNRLLTSNKYILQLEDRVNYHDSGLEERLKQCQESHEQVVYLATELELKEQELAELNASLEACRN